MQEQGKEPTLLQAPESAAEGLVITKSQAEVIRQMHREGVAKKAIARGLDLDIKTVRRAINHDWRVQTRTRHSKLEPFAEFIANRFSEVGFNAAVIDRELRAMGYEVSYPVVARHVRTLRPRAAELEPVIRYETAPGKQAQADWGMLTVWIGEQPVKVHFFTMVLGYSRRIFARAYLHERICTSGSAICSTDSSGPSSTSAAGPRRCCSTTRARSCCGRTTRPAQSSGTARSKTAWTSTAST